jgi:hypothetical protein
MLYTFLRVSEAMTTATNIFLLGLASTVISGSTFRTTHDYVIASHIYETVALIRIIVYISGEECGRRHSRRTRCWWEDTYWNGSSPLSRLPVVEVRTQFQVSPCSGHSGTAAGISFLIIISSNASSFCHLRLLRQATGMISWTQSTYIFEENQLSDYKLFKKSV